MSDQRSEAQDTARAAAVVESTARWRCEHCGTVVERTVAGEHPSARLDLDAPFWRVRFLPPDADLFFDVLACGACVRRIGGARFVAWVDKTGGT